MPSRPATAMVLGRTHIVPLGYLSRVDGWHQLTVGDRVGGDKRQYRLMPEHRELLASLDPMVLDREFSSQEQHLLRAMATDRMVAPLGAGAPLSALDVIPVPRQSLAVVGTIDDSYRIRVGDGWSIVLSEYEGRLLPLIDGHRTLADILREVEGRALVDPDDRRMIAEAELEEGRSFEAYLFELAISFIATTRRSGALTFEPRE